MKKQMFLQRLLCLVTVFALLLGSAGAMLEGLLGEPARQVAEKLLAYTASDALADSPCTDGEHVWNDWVMDYDNGKSVRTCTVCGKVEEIPDTGNGPHKMGEWTVTKPATCTEEGEQIHTCQFCDMEETVSLPMVDHDWIDQYSEEKHWKECTYCGQKTEVGYPTPQPTIAPTEQLTVSAFYVDGTISITVSAEGTYEIWIDGRSTGSSIFNDTSATIKYNLDAGEHQITVLEPFNLVTATATITVAAKSVDEPLAEPRACF